MVHFQSLYWICYNIASLLCFDFLTARLVGFLPSPSLLSMPYNRPINQRWSAEARNMTLLGKLADWEGSRQISQRNHLVRQGLDASVFHRTQSWDMRKQSKKAINLANISWNGQPREEMCYFLPPVAIHVDRSWTEAEGRGFLRQAIMYGQYPCSKQTNRKQRLK